MRPIPLLLVLCGAANACADRQSAPDHSPYDAAAPAPLACIPDLDGKIDAQELVPAIGVPVRYLVSPAGKERPVNVAGSVDAQGRRSWDMSVDLADDQASTIQASAIAGKWYAGSFPGAEFTAPFDAAGAVDAVYVRDAASIGLAGLASANPSPPEGKTLLVYDAPVAIYRFPLAPGVAYASVGQTKSAIVRGLPYAGRDTYDIKVDAAGSLKLPQLSFTQALRVRTEVTIEPAAGAKTTHRQVSFLFECFGEVARATSKDNEPAEDFTTAAEVRRLGIGL